MMSTEDLKNVLGSLVAGIENENKERFEKMASLPAVQEALEAVRQGEPEHFYFSLIYPLSLTIDGLLAHELPGSSEAQFLYKHSQFVENHYQRLIEKFEDLRAALTSQEP